VWILYRLSNEDSENPLTPWLPCIITDLIPAPFVPRLRVQYHVPHLRFPTLRWWIRVRWHQYRSLLPGLISITGQGNRLLRENIMWADEIFYLTYMCGPICSHSYRTRGSQTKVLFITAYYRTSNKDRIGVSKYSNKTDQVQGSRHKTQAINIVKPSLGRVAVYFIPRKMPCHHRLSQVTLGNF